VKLYLIIYREREWTGEGVEVHEIRESMTSCIQAHSSITPTRPKKPAIPKAPEELEDAALLLGAAVSEAFAEVEVAPVLLIPSVRYKLFNINRNATLRAAYRPSRGAGGFCNSCVEATKRNDIVSLATLNRTKK
jgi:hypothetical protein